ncbi:MAG: aminotransferase class I/II-fold pyridoxal phosphate-dependent enzyme [Alphaproteobacteria bacterium]|nr:aminotransferase class I/II-fold pyridoxal phosphate-dependent enzyme [Alphaproteobacteria bacterium]
MAKGPEDPLKSAGLSTRAVHGGTAPDPTTGARITPIHQTASYVFKDTEHAARLFNLDEFGQIYSRITNPTVQALEGKMAALDGGVGAIAAASGHAAQFLAVLPLMEAGDEIVSSRNLYGGSITQFSHSFSRLGWRVAFVDPFDADNFRAALTPRTRAIFTESLSNPGGLMVDLEAIAAVAREAKVPLIVDNTLATPALCRPFEWGADIAVYSTTKFIAGHGNAIGGVIVDSGGFHWDARYPALSAPNAAYHGTRFAEKFGPLAYAVYGHAVGLRDFGPAMAPMTAFLTLTGAETLTLRMARHSQNAMAVATYLEGHDQVSWVSYAGLPSSPSFDLAAKYLPDGAGAVLTFGLKGGFDAGVKTVEACRLFSHLANVGDTRSLVIHPASTTHRQLSDDERAAAGAGPEVVRLSVGIEDAADLIEDLDQAIAAAAR